MAARERSGTSAGPQGFPRTKLAAQSPGQNERTTAPFVSARRVSGAVREAAKSYSTPSRYGPRHTRHREAIGGAGVGDDQQGVKFPGNFGRAEGRGGTKTRRPRGSPQRKTRCLSAKKRARSLCPTAPRPHASVPLAGESCLQDRELGLGRRHLRAPRRRVDVGTPLS